MREVTIEVICAVCRKPVDRIDCEYDIQRREQIYRVFCHGAIEEFAMPDKLVRDAVHVGVGQAFAFKQVAAGPALPAVVSVVGMPEHTLVCGDVISVNVGGPSPRWVLELIKTGAGRAVFLGWVRSLTEAGHVR